MVRNVIDNKKGFYKYLGDKRKAKETVGSLLKEMGDLVMKGMRYYTPSLLQSLQARPAFRNPRSQ